MVDPVLEARRLHHYHRLTIPVQPELLASELGIDVVSARLSENLSGLLLPEPGGKYIILVNSRHRPTRRRFSIAHELGHFHLHRGLQIAFTNHRRHHGRLEREADLFAAELLMPREAVEHAAKSANFNDLVRIFEVSAAAMKRRLAELRVKPKEAIA